MNKLKKITSLLLSTAITAQLCGGVLEAFADHCSSLEYVTAPHTLSAPAVSTVSPDAVSTALPKAVYTTTYAPNYPGWDYDFPEEPFLFDVTISLFNAETKEQVSGIKVKFCEYADKSCSPDSYLGVIDCFTTGDEPYVIHDLLIEPEHFYIMIVEEMPEGWANGYDHSSYLERGIEGKYLPVIGYNHFEYGVVPDRAPVWDYPVSGVGEFTLEFLDYDSFMLNQQGELAYKDIKRVKGIDVSVYTGHLDNKTGQWDSLEFMHEWFDSDMYAFTQEFEYNFTSDEDYIDFALDIHDLPNEYSGEMLGLYKTGGYYLLRLYAESVRKGETDLDAIVKKDTRPTTTSTTATTTDPKDLVYQIRPIHLPYKLEYFVGEELDLAGGVITVVIYDKEDNLVNYFHQPYDASMFVVECPEFDKPGNYQVKVFRRSTGDFCFHFDVSVGEIPSEDELYFAGCNYRDLRVGFTQGFTVNRMRDGVGLAASKDVKFTLSDETIGEIYNINGNTVYFRGLAAGETILTAETPDGKTAFIKIRVYEEGSGSGISTSGTTTLPTTSTNGTTSPTKTDTTTTTTGIGTTCHNEFNVNQLNNGFEVGDELDLDAFDVTMSVVGNEGVMSTWDVKLSDSRYRVEHEPFDHAGKYIINFIDTQTNTHFLKEVYVYEKGTLPSGDWGDVNGDGKVTIADAVLVMQHLANPSKYSISEDGAKAADVDNNGNGVTSADALMISSYLIQLVPDLRPVLE